MRKQAPRNVQIAVWLAMGMAATGILLWFVTRGWPTGHPLGLPRLQVTLFALPVLCALGAIKAYRSKSDDA